MFCSNCGKQIEDNSNFCEHCGAGIADGGTQNVPPMQYNSCYPPVTAPPVKKSGNGVLKGCLIATGAFVLLGILLCVALYHFNDDFREGFDEGIEESGYHFSSQVKYSYLSSSEQEKLMNSLYERLDKFFINVLQDDEQLMQLFVIGALGENNEAMQDKMLEKKFGDKMLSIVEEWSEENNVDVEDFGNNIDEDEFAAGYFLHLMEVFMSSQNE
jgi:hypothetical protein